MLILSAAHLRLLRESSPKKRLIWVDIGGGTGLHDFLLREIPARLMHPAFKDGISRRWTFTSQSPNLTLSISSIYAFLSLKLRRNASLAVAGRTYMLYARTPALSPFLSGRMESTRLDR
jgi:hypothetical protein